jgi:hypothetical protein
MVSVVWFIHPALLSSGVLQLVENASQVPPKNV